MWEEVKGVIEVVNSWMMPFLKLFGVEVGNGLSPFAVDIDTPSDLLALIDQFFKPPKRDMRGNTTLDDKIMEVDVEVDGEVSVDEGSRRENNGANTLPVSVMAGHVREIR